MTPLRQQMIRELELHRKAPDTVKSYVKAVEDLARHYRRSPDQISKEEVRVNSLNDPGAMHTSIKQALHCTMCPDYVAFINLRIALRPDRRGFRTSRRAEVAGGGLGVG